MLNRTFCHLHGISTRREKSLWHHGVERWDDFADPRHLDELEKSRQAIADDDAAFFASRLASKERWRIFPTFRHRTAYLDIETTGFAADTNKVTSIALYDGEQILYYVQGENLDDFIRDIASYQQIVTYNGTGFDIPFLERTLGCRFPQAHLDLRYILAALGLRGGLKGCEHQLGLDRGDLEGVDGYFAVLLWQEYQRSGDPKARETLLAYNIEDVVNLETLMVIAYNRHLAATPFADETLSLPERPEIPFTPHLPLIEKLRRERGTDDTSFFRLR